ITDTVTQAQAMQNYTVNIPAIVGANTAYVGFTAATGGRTAFHNVLNWVYATGVVPLNLVAPQASIATTASVAVPTAMASSLVDSGAASGQTLVRESTNAVRVQGDVVKASPSTAVFAKVGRRLRSDSDTEVVPIVDEDLLDLLTGTNRQIAMERQVRPKLRLSLQ
ncbi:MAG: hypothetical protein AB7O59_15255, partial [Pirellulales bacterium]